jgi:hypothetical protein
MDVLQAPTRQRPRRARLVVEPDEDLPLKGRALDRLVRALSEASNAGDERDDALADERW